MKKIIISLWVGMFGWLCFAQNISISPYSGIGIGDQIFDQNVAVNAMAGTFSTAIGEFGSELNFTNPAANRNLSFTTFSANGSTDIMNFKASNLNSNRSVSYLSDLAIGFPITEKIKFGLGFQPFSSVGYNVKRKYEDLDPQKTIKLDGDGGVNSIHSFVSYNFNKQWSVGIRTNYLFGNIDKNQEVTVDQADLVANYANHYNVHSFIFSAGTLYIKDLKDNKRLAIGSSIGLGNKLNLKNEYLHSTYYYNTYNQPVLIDTITYTKNKEKGKLGTQVSLGISFTKTFKYRLALEALYQGKPDYSFENNFYQVNSSFRLAFGGWVIPDINSYKSYFDRINYRFGTYYEKGQLNINGYDINQFGITFGFGLPIGKVAQDPSMVNIAVDVGRRGTTQSNLIQENFINLKFGLNFNDRWFQKRKYN